MQQLSLLPKNPTFYGGEIPQKRKSIRPLCTKRAVHFVLKAKKKALYKHKSFLDKEIRRIGSKFHIRIYSIAVNHDHIHFVAKISSRREYIAFIRSLTGILARKFGKKLWALLPFSRVLEWGKDFRQALSYLKKNRGEASGVLNYEERKDWYGRFRVLRP